MDLVPIIDAAGKEAATGETAAPLRQAIGSTLAEAWQAIVGDRIAAWRVSNASEISQKLSRKLEAKGLTIESSKIPPKYAFTWFEEASKQDKPEIQEIFATLLANAATGNTDALAERNLEIVSKLSPLSAQIIEDISNNIRLANTLFEDDKPQYIFDLTERKFFETILKENYKHLVIEYEDLVRIGVLDKYFTLDTSTLEDRISEIKNAIDRMSSYEIKDFSWYDLVEANYSVTLSEIGWSLCKAVYPEKFAELAKRN